MAFLSWNKIYAKTLAYFLGLTLLAYWIILSLASLEFISDIEWVARAGRIVGLFFIFLAVTFIVSNFINYIRLGKERVPEIKRIVKVDLYSLTFAALIYITSLIFN